MAKLTLDYLLAKIDSKKGHVALIDTAERNDLSDLLVHTDLAELKKAEMEMDKSTRRNLVFVLLNVLDFDTGMDMVRDLVLSGAMDRMRQTEVEALDEKWTEVFHAEQAVAEQRKFFGKRLGQLREKAERLTSRLAWVKSHRDSLATENRNLRSALAEADADVAELAELKSVLGRALS